MKEIQTNEALRQLIDENREITNVGFQGLNLLPFKKELLAINFHDCLFLGCILDPELLEKMCLRNFVFPSLKLPFTTFPSSLYSRHDLYAGFETADASSYQESPDHKTYLHFKEHGKEPDNLRITLARRLHDHGISDALHELLKQYDARKVVAIMGGHSMSRDAPIYRQIAELSARLAQLGYLMVSGGGPGAMEATHLGVWLAGQKTEIWDNAFDILSTAPSYKDEAWLSTAFQVIEQYPPAEELTSLGIPTWLYGHEPPTPFASHIAKYFANSIREDGLLAIAKGGVIYSQGSAGTIQEIFQDATQNHYITEEFSSPMIFLGKKYWEEDYPIYSLLKKLLEEGKYKNLLLSVTDDSTEVIAQLKAFSEEGEIQA